MTNMKNSNDKPGRHFNAGIANPSPWSHKSSLPLLPPPTAIAAADRMAMAATSAIETPHELYPNVHAIATSDSRSPSCQQLQHQIQHPFKSLSHRKSSIINRTQCLRLYFSALIQYTLQRLLCRRNHWVLLLRRRRRIYRSVMLFWMSRTAVTTRRATSWIVGIKSS